MELLKTFWLSVFLIPLRMWAITSALSNQFKIDLWMGTHLFKASAGDTFKMALYVAAATLDKTTSTYSSTNEVANGNGYTTGGFTMTGLVDPALSGDTVCIDWTTDPNWPAASFTARGCQIYNFTKSNKTVAVIDFGADKTATNGTFTVVLPTADASNAILRMA